MVLDVGKGGVERDRLDVTALSEALGEVGTGGELEHALLGDSSAPRCLPWTPDFSAAM